MIKMDAKSVRCLRRVKLEFALCLFIGGISFDTITALHLINNCFVHSACPIKNI